MEPELKPHEARPSVALAREWFDRFGADETVISPTGRRLFRFLLGQLLKPTAICTHESCPFLEAK